MQYLMFFLILFISSVWGNRLSPEVIDSLKNEHYRQSTKSSTDTTVGLAYQYDSILDSAVLYSNEEVSSAISTDSSIEKLFYQEYNEFNDVKPFMKRIQPADTLLKRFGASFLSHVSTQKQSSGPVNPDYRIGVGDEIVIVLWGDVQFTKSFVVNRIGTISPKGVGQVMVTGLSLKELKSLLLKRFSRVYSGVKNGNRYATTFVDVALGRLRKKDIYVVGDVHKPGKYSVLSMQSFLEVLSKAGGPTTRGSLREIYIRRDNQDVDTVDLYNYFLTGITKDTVTLADYDIIIVPPVKREVSLVGAVHRPAIYELKEGETVQDLFRYAGGLLPESYKQSFNILRTIANKERKLLTIDENISETTVALSKNDHITITFIDEVDNSVTIEGAVKREGSFACHDGMMLSDLLKLSGGVRDDYFPDRAEILRTQDDYTKEVVSVNVGLLLRDGAGDIALRKWDLVKIFSQWDITHHSFVVIRGEVENPGKYFLRDNMTVHDLILLAGGFTEKAYKDSVELSQIVSSNKQRGNTTRATKIAVGTDFTTSNGRYLDHMDNVFVRENSSFHEQDVVYLKGEFSYPGFYAKLYDGETLLSLIQRSGGIKEGAYLEGARFIRAKDSIGTVALNVKALIEKNNLREDIILEDGDTLYIPTEPKTVIVQGSVNYPTAVKFVSGKNLRYYIKRAGGLSSQADKKSLFVVLANGEVQQSSLGSRSINAGSRIVISDKDETKKEKFDWAAFSVVISAIGTLTMATVAIINVTDK